MRKLRITYAALFAILLGVEIMIALYVHDDFVRPYIGDVLVTTLLCALCRIIAPKGIPALPIFVFIFAALMETAQYLNVVKWLGLEHNRFLSTIIGTTFSWLDILCYGVGCVLFGIIERIVAILWSGDV